MFDEEGEGGAGEGFEAGDFGLHEGREGDAGYVGGCVDYADADGGVGGGDFEVGWWLCHGDVVDL